jgi:peptidoglycan/LPS O-acetylase OafA/YrhL
MIKNRNNNIALVQIVSALLIVNYHTSALDIPVLNHIAKFGFIFNTVFVFLSGSLLSKSLFAEPSPGFRQFIYRRINRIYPSLHVALAAIAVIYLSTGNEFTVRSLLFAATGFSYFFYDNTFGLHLWFVSVVLVCYVLSIPTCHALKRNPAAFFIFIICLFLLTAYTREGSLNGLYNKVSSDILYRFIYHYMVFSLAIYMGTMKDENNQPRRKWIGLLVAAVSLSVWLQTDMHPGIIAIGLSILLAVCIIQIILMISPFVDKHLSKVLLLSPLTYELYLVHYSVIGALNKSCHGKFISYPLVFIFSIALAFMVLMLSRPYERLTRRWTGLLLDR